MVICEGNSNEYGFLDSVEKQSGYCCFFFIEFLIEELGKYFRGFLKMAVPWSMTLWMARMIWMALGSWVVSCLGVADEIAGSLRTGDIGPFHVD